MLITVPVVLPAKGNLAFGDVLQSLVGDGHSVRVAAEIFEHLLRPGERPLGVDYPVSLTVASKPPRKGLWFG